MTYLDALLRLIRHNPADTCYRLPAEPRLVIPSAEGGPQYEYDRSVTSRRALTHSRERRPSRDLPDSDPAGCLPVTQEEAK